MSDNKTSLGCLNDNLFQDFSPKDESTIAGGGNYGFGKKKYTPVNGKFVVDKINGKQVYH